MSPPPQVPYIGSTISLLSKANIRYEGFLYTIDQKESSVALSHVKVFGTEDRQCDRPVPPSDEIFEFIIFRASDITELKVIDTPPVRSVPDPAIIRAQNKAPADQETNASVKDFLMQAGPSVANSAGNASAGVRGREPKREAGNNAGQSASGGNSQRYPRSQAQSGANAANVNRAQPQQPQQQQQPPAHQQQSQHQQQQQSQHQHQQQQQQQANRNYQGGKQMYGGGGAGGGYNYYGNGGGYHQHQRRNYGNGGYYGAAYHHGGPPPYAYGRVGPYGNGGPFYPPPPPPQAMFGYGGQRRGGRPVMHFRRYHGNGGPPMPPPSYGGGYRNGRYGWSNRQHHQQHQAVDPIPARFTADYDFETANAEMEAELAKLVLGEGHQTGEGDVNEAADAAADQKRQHTGYDKEKSFYDDISRVDYDERPGAGDFRAANAASDAGGNSGGGSGGPANVVSANKKEAQRQNALNKETFGLIGGRMRRGIGNRFYGNRHYQQSRRAPA